MSFAAEMKKYIEEYARPRVQSDGGEIRFISYSDNVLTVKLQGECSRCPIAKDCLPEWLTEDINKNFGENVIIKQIVEKPYFWNA